VDILPSEAFLEVPLGEENASWPLEPAKANPSLEG